jgi:hypothetical protein
MSTHTMAVKTQKLGNAFRQSVLGRKQKMADKLPLELCYHLHTVSRGANGQGIVGVSGFEDGLDKESIREKVWG